MRLADFILKNIEPILQKWEKFAKTLTPAADCMDSAELRDHAEQMLRTIAADLKTVQSHEERVLRSQGDAPRDENETAAETHADTRYASGFSIGQMIAEYRALRTSVLMLWMPPDQVSQEQQISDVVRFNEAIDQSLAESVVAYTNAVDAARNVFLGILGHDLRSPLGAISLSSELLLGSDELSPKVTKNVTRIFTSANRSIKIVGDLLDFTRTQLGSGIPVRVELGDLVPVCSGMVEEARAVHPERKIEIQSDYRLLGNFDRARMEQVIANLIGNAIQHGDTDAPVLVTLKSERGYAFVSVRNEGLPIDPSARAMLFDPMARHLRAGKEEYGSGAGLGLGLYIASAIVTAHRGTIEVESVASGTTFTVCIPLNLSPTV